MDVQVIKRSELSDGNFVGADHGGVGICVIFNNSAPGHGPGQHTHPYEEVFITLEGTATFLVDGQEIVGTPDEVVVVPPNTPHGFTNTGEGPLRMVNIHVSPAFSTNWL